MVQPFTASCHGKLSQHNGPTKASCRLPGHHANDLQTKTSICASHINDSAINPINGNFSSNIQLICFYSKYDVECIY